MVKAAGGYFLSTVALSPQCEGCREGCGGIVKYEAMKLLRSQKLMNLRSYQEAVKLCMWFCVNYCSV
jgi:hypothetical protein